MRRFFSSPSASWPSRSGSLPEKTGKMSGTAATKVTSSFDDLLGFLAAGEVIALCGAGCSTESGIPDYRGPGRPVTRRGPIQFREFMEQATARARYWARSSAGWARFSSARPNPCHLSLAHLESLGVIRRVITQNVDGLHHAAGSRRVLELHGSLSLVRCMACHATTRRHAVQERLRDLNPDFSPQADVPAPDGDADLPDSAWAGFRVPACLQCGGILKPDVVFFGESVPRARVEEAWRVFEAGTRLLVLGSSLTVFSGRRFVLRAAQEERPVAVVNLGPTRADEVAAVRLEARLGEVLPGIVRALEN